MNGEDDISKHLLNIATALVGSSLTLFLGSGFTKHLTGGQAPSWNQLLYHAAGKLEATDLKEKLFPSESGQKSSLNLTIIAQILEDEFKKENKNFKEEIAQIINQNVNEKTIDKEKIQEIKDFFATMKENINIITTNFDEVITDELLPYKSKVYTEGSTLSKVKEVKNIYHIHGAISRPSSLILTQDDYFKFQHKEGYISRKIFTLLQETTTVILGYSLNDFNLNRILNESKHMTNGDWYKNRIYYVSRSKVSDIDQSYFLKTFGIHVIEKMEIDEFLNELKAKEKKAEDIIKRGVPSVERVLRGDEKYDSDFLKLSSSFDGIIMSMNISGMDFNRKENQQFLIDILKEKKKFTKESQAWEQYMNLAEDLIELGTIFKIENEEVKQQYIMLVDHSFSTMSEEMLLGFSWHTFRIWEARWTKIRTYNKKFLKSELLNKVYNNQTGVCELIESLDTT